MTFAVVARYTCAPEDVSEIRSRLMAMREHTLQEPANLAYVVHQDAEDPHIFLLYEQYLDRSGFDAHAQTPHFAEHIAGFIRPRLLERTAYFSEVL